MRFLNQIILLFAILLMILPYTTASEDSSFLRKNEEIDRDLAGCIPSGERTLLRFCAYCCSRNCVVTQVPYGKCR